MEAKELCILAIGLLVGLTPYVGLPSGWKTGLYVIFGIAIVVLAYLIRSDQASAGQPHTPAQDIFVENGMQGDDATPQSHHGEYEHGEEHQETREN
jgi:hypothetical protein